MSDNWLELPLHCTCCDIVTKQCVTTLRTNKSTNHYNALHYNQPTFELYRLALVVFLFCFLCVIQTTTLQPEQLYYDKTLFVKPLNRRKAKNNYTQIYETMKIEEHTQ